MVDVVDPSEISEDTVLFVDGHQVARFRLDAQHHEGSAEIDVPDTKLHMYALCGRITLLRPDGGTEQRVVDGGGILHDPDGHTFQALAAGDFHIFYLAQASDPQPPADARHVGACDLPVA